MSYSYFQHELCSPPYLGLAESKKIPREVIFRFKVDEMHHCTSMKACAMLEDPMATQSLIDTVSPWSEAILTRVELYTLEQGKDFDLNKASL